MASFNLRLTQEDVQAIKALRQDNVNVSQLLREAIRTAHKKRRPKRVVWTPAKIDSMLAKIDAIQEGETPDWIEQGLDVTDRKQMSTYLREQGRRRLGKLADL